MNTMLFIKGFIIGLIVMSIISIIVFFIYRHYKSKSKSIDIEASTIMKSVENISKLMVLEGQFTETYSYHEKNKIFFDLIPQEKKALIILNAKVLVGYDLKKMVVFIDKLNRKLVIEKLPEEEINIIPDIKFYDIQTSTFSQFTKDDINKVQQDAKAKISEQIEYSPLKTQAKERLIENLNSLVLITQAVGWKIEDHTQTINNTGIPQIDK